MSAILWPLLGALWKTLGFVAACVVLLGLVVWVGSLRGSK